jgi:single-strand DNA-binding protein
MANLNKVHLIGRLTKDPECRSFANGGKVAQIRFAVNNRKKNQQTGAWEDVPVWLDVKAFNRETGRKLADTCEQYLRKGHQCYIEGHLLLEEWEDKNGGGKRSKLVIVMDDLQFLEPRSEGQAGGSGSMRSGGYAPARQQTPAQDYGESPGGADGPDFSPEGPSEGDIPF